MTGYGHSIYRTPDYIIEMEVKSYNSRYLEFTHSINPLLSAYESYLDESLKSVCARGHLDVSLRLKTLKSQAAISVDENLLSEYRKALEKISLLTGCEAPKLSDYVSLEGVLAQDRNTEAEFYRPGVEAVVKEVLSSLKASKERDGEGTQRDLKALGEKFQSSLDVILEKRETLEEYFKSVLLQKYEELLGEKGKDDPRFLSEVAALLVKYSINEECSRLSVHMKEYWRLLEADEPVGKKIDFLCQEMNREVNTTASKSQLVEVNLEVVKMKDALEDIREQIRNIE